MHVLPAEQAFLSSCRHGRAVQSIKRAHVVVHLFDVTEEISQVDKKLAACHVQSYKPAVLVGNKVDLADRVRLDQWDAYIRQQLAGLRHAPVSFISAKNDINIDATLNLICELREQARTTIPTARLNEVLQQARTRLMPKSKGKVPKLFYGTQVGSEPLTVLIFVNEPSLFRGQYDRYLQNRLREAFACQEVPIRILFRRRQKVQLEPI